MISRLPALIFNLLLLALPAISQEQGRPRLIKLEIAPAFVKDKSARFTLHAVGGFEVSAEIVSGVVRWICVKSLHGNICRIQSPWERAKVTVKQKPLRHEQLNGIISFPTKKSEIVLLTPDGPISGLSFNASETPQQNQNAKFHPSGKAQLGLPRMF